MLEATGLACERGGRTLFRNLDLSLASGELLRIAGDNGSGKTSLLRILCGLLAPSAGEVRWDRNSITRLREEFSQRIVYLGHAPAVKGDLTAAENLSISCALTGKPVPTQAVQEALAQLGLSEITTPVRKLSQGQRRRAALARLALSETLPLWLLDEPFAALDAPGIALLNQLLAQRLANGGMIVVTTHQDPGIAATRV